MAWRTSWCPLQLPEGNVVAGLADVLRDHAPALQEAEYRAAKAEPGEGLQGSSDDEHGQQNPRRRCQAREEQRGRRSGNRSADPLGEPLGRSGNQLGAPSRGASTLTESSASGEILGPKSTRSQKPAAMMARPQPKPVSSVAAASSTTSPAVMRAAYSLTGLGKANTARQSTPPLAVAGDTLVSLGLLMQQG